MEIEKLEIANKLVTEIKRLEGILFYLEKYELVGYELRGCNNKSFINDYEVNTIRNILIANRKIELFKLKKQLKNL